MRPSFCTAGLLVLALLAGCTISKDDASEPPKRPPKDAPTPDDGKVRPVVASNLQWKRSAAFEADLAAALELAPGDLCSEFGTEPCIRKVHMVPLGGNEPFLTGMLEAAQEPLASTPTVVDRIVLTACANRVARDREAGSKAEVFDAFPLDGKAPAPTDKATRTLVTDLYRRLLARDPAAHEVDRIAALARDEDGKAVGASDFAKLACYAIGTSAEFLFF